MDTSLTEVPGADGLPVEAFLAGYPVGIRETANGLRAIVRSALPNAIERVRPGCRLVGYDIPVGKRKVYFAFVIPEPAHVHLGFEHGIFMADPERRLEGAHLRLRKVRFVTFKGGEPVPEMSMLELTREAARIAAMTREARFSLLMDRDLMIRIDRVQDRQ